MRNCHCGWVMPEADMLVMLGLIDEKIRSPGIDVRHRDVLIRLREILENNLNDFGFDGSSIGDYQEFRVGPLR